MSPVCPATSLGPGAWPLVWLGPRHLTELLAMERPACDPPRSHSAFRNLLRAPQTLGRALLQDSRGPLVAFGIVTILPKVIVLEDLAVHVAWQRRGIGRRLLAELLDEPFCRGRGRVVAAVREQNLSGQLFLRGCGLRAIGILSRFYVTEDAYHFMASTSPPGGG